MGVISVFLEQYSLFCTIRWDIILSALLRKISSFRGILTVFGQHVQFFSLPQFSRPVMGESSAASSRFPVIFSFPGKPVLLRRIEPSGDTSAA